MSAPITEEETMMRTPPFMGEALFQQMHDKLFLRGLRDSFAAHLLPAVYESYAIADRNDCLPAIGLEEFMQRIAEEGWLLADAMVQERERRIKGGM